MTNFSSMLRSLDDLRRYRVHATDGEAGRVEDFFFDGGWTVRWLLVHTEGKRILVSPIAVWRADWTDRTIEVDFGRELLEQCPSLEPGEKVTRELEVAQHQRFGWPYYWGGAGRWGPFVYAAELAALPLPEQPPREEGELHGVIEALGSLARASDGELGTVEDFIADDESWAIRYAVVSTLGRPTKRVLIAPSWIDSVSWASRELHLSLPSRTVIASPGWDPSQPVNRALELRLYDYYGRPVYWHAESAP